CASYDAYYDWYFDVW
nr:immunoglobulin heavy chain junction region [Mus musculus]MBK4188789.1 immunoglobulin heavy chain junction region [Mus musculus]